MTADDRRAGLVRALLGLLAELDEREEQSPSGREPTDRISVRSSVSFAGLDDAIDNGRATSLIVTTRSIEGGSRVVADLSGLRTEDISVDLERAGRTLTITDDDFAAEVLLDETFRTVADVSFNNGIMEVRLLYD